VGAACSAFELLLPKCIANLDTFVQREECIQSVHEAVCGPLRVFFQYTSLPSHTPWPSSPLVPGSDSDARAWADFESAAFGQQGLLAKLVAKTVTWLHSDSDISIGQSARKNVDCVFGMLTELLSTCAGSWQALNAAATACDKVVTAAASAGLLRDPSVSLYALMRQLLATCRLPLTWTRSRLQRAGGGATDAPDPSTPLDKPDQDALRRMLGSHAQALQAAMQQAGVQPAPLTSALLQGQLAADPCTRSAFFLWRVLARVALLCPSAALVPGKAHNSVLQLWLDAYDVVCVLELLPYPVEGVQGAALSESTSAVLDVQWLPICMQAVLQQTARAWLSKALQGSGKHCLLPPHAALCMRQILAANSPGAVFCVALTDTSLLIKGTSATGACPPLLGRFLAWLAGRCAVAHAAAAARSQFQSWLAVAAASVPPATLSAALQAAQLRAVQPSAVAALLSFLQGSLTQKAPPGQPLRPQPQEAAAAAGTLLEQAMVSESPGGLVATWAGVCALAPSLFCSALLGHSGLNLVTFASQGGTTCVAQRCAAVLSSIRWRSVCLALPAGRTWAPRWLALLDAVAARAIRLLQACNKGRVSMHHMACIQCLLAVASAGFAFSQLSSGSPWQGGISTKEAQDSMQAALGCACVAAVGTPSVAIRMCVLLESFESRLAPPLATALRGAQSQALSQNRQAATAAVQAVKGGSA